ncbi:sugar transferase [Mycobacterium sp. WMMD1722]|uniref:sugar transferase n=1 Tax=Mycobacterium sp. WMMD1722 TaxID=3404117 RepID=UPI003BF5E32F
MDDLDLHADRGRQLDSGTRRVMPPTAARVGRLPAALRRDPLRTVVAVTVDVVCAGLAVGLAGVWASGTQTSAPPVWLATLFVPLVVVLLGVRSLYRPNLNRRIMDEVGPVETTVMLAAMLVLTVMTFSNTTGRPGGLMSKVWICAAVLMPSGRVLHVTLQRRLSHRHLLAAPTLIVGNGMVAHQIAERLSQSDRYGLKPIGLLSVEDPWSGSDATAPTALPRLGPPESIAEAIAATGAEAVIVAFSVMQDHLLTRVVPVALEHRLRVWVVPRMFDVVGQGVRVEHIGGLPLLAVAPAHPRGWRFAVKHACDRVLAGAGLVALSPLLLLLAALIALTSRGPILFRQQRVGRDGQVFDCLKFRTMREPAETDGDFALEPLTAPGGVEGRDRRTPIGKIMRATSMDELPQLVNVVRGEMSLVGPRPERPEYVDAFEADIRRYGERHRVKAGVTGWAQVHGLRGQTSLQDRAEWDNYYIENWSLTLDVKILALTVPAMLRRAE